MWISKLDKKKKDDITNEFQDMIKTITFQVRFLLLTAFLNSDIVSVLNYLLYFKIHFSHWLIHFL